MVIKLRDKKWPDKEFGSHFLDFMIDIQLAFMYCGLNIKPAFKHNQPTIVVYIVGSRGASQLGGSLLGIPLGYKANKL